MMAMFSGIPSSQSQVISVNWSNNIGYEHICTYIVHFIAMCELIHCVFTFLIGSEVIILNYINKRTPIISLHHVMYIASVALTSSVHSPG